MTPQQLKAMKLALSTLREVQSETFRLLRNGQRLYAEEKVWNTIIEIKQALAENAMRKVQRLGQEIEQEPLAWPCLIDSADFSENTITLVMQCENYKVSAGTHYLSTTRPQRTWVGLTKNERLELYRQFENCFESDNCEYEKAIEQALKERNQ